MSIPVETDEYHPRVVAYLDVLGFSDMVEKADDPIWREAIAKVVATMRTAVPNSEMFGDQRVTQFSDCVVISAKADVPAGPVMVMYGVLTLARVLLSDGILLRGGIAVGNLVHTEERLFGPALLAAYRKDDRGAPPRIAIDPSVEPFIDRVPGMSLGPWVCEDSYDLTPMVDVLAFYRMHLPGADGPRNQTFLNEAASIVGHIVRNSSNREHPAAVRAKWLWLRRYWNESVSQAGYFPTA